MIPALAASLGLDPSDPAFWMPLLFMGLLFLLVAGGAVLDGFDLGVGLLLGAAPPAERTRMMILLSPWRDANEFWLLLGAGLFFAAFPFAWGAIAGQLYLPLTLMLLGTVLRSVSFEFRLRANAATRPRWIAGFWLGSLLTAFSHGLLLARVVTGYADQPGYLWLALFVGVCAVAAYALLGATWLAMRVEGLLQRAAVGWARHATRWAAAGMVAVSVVLGLANGGVFYKWSNLSDLVVAAAIWGVMLACFVAIEMLLNRMARGQALGLAWLPFALSVLLFLLTLGGLGYSLFPYLILDDLTLWDGAAATGSLRLVLAATVVCVPVMAVFNVLAYRTLFGRERGAEAVAAASVPRAG